MKPATGATVCAFLFSCMAAGRAETSPSLRSEQYTTRSAEEAVAWQKTLRPKLARLLQMEDLLAGKKSLPLVPEVISSVTKTNYEVMEEVRLIYADMNRPENVILDVHDGGHVIDLPALLAFFEKHL